MNPDRRLIGRLVDRRYGAASEWEQTHMRSLMLAAVAAFAFVSIAGAAPNCTKGVVCGNTCIAKGKVCHIKAAPPAKPVQCKDPKTGKFIKCPKP